MGTYVRQRSNNVLIRITKKLGLFIVIVVIPFLLFAYSFNIKQVEVVGAERYEDEQIKKMVFNTRLDSNSLYLYLKYSYLDKPQFPFIERIDVKLIKPGIVKLNVYEKMVAGCVEIMGEYFYFDKDGIVVESSANKFEDVPLIKGLKFSEIVLHEKLSVQKDITYIPYDELASSEDNSGDISTSSVVSEKKTNSEKNEVKIMNGYVFDTIIKLTQLIDKYNIKVDTVSFNNNYEVTLECDGITVLLGKKSTYDEALSELKNILKEVEGMQLTIDMKSKLKDTGSIIAKPKK